MPNGMAWTRRAPTRAERHGLGPQGPTCSCGERQKWAWRRVPACVAARRQGRLTWFKMRQGRKASARREGPRGASPEAQMMWPPVSTPACAHPTCRPPRELNPCSHHTGGGLDHRGHGLSRNSTAQRQSRCKSTATQACPPAYLTAVLAAAALLHLATVFLQVPLPPLAHCQCCPCWWCLWWWCRCRYSDEPLASAFPPPALLAAAQQRSPARLRHALLLPQPLLPPPHRPLTCPIYQPAGG